MTHYRNLSGNSNVVSYQVTEDSILVVFRSGRCRNYLYNSVSPGQQLVEKMKALAEQGHGLNSFISTVVRDRYARKW